MAIRIFNPDIEFQAQDWVSSNSNSWHYFQTQWQSWGNLKSPSIFVFKKRHKQYLLPDYLPDNWKSFLNWSETFFQGNMNLFQKIWIYFKKDMSKRYEYISCFCESLYKAYKKNFIELSMMKNLFLNNIPNIYVLSSLNMLAFCTNSNNFFLPKNWSVFIILALS